MIPILPVVMTFTICYYKTLKPYLAVDVLVGAEHGQTGALGATGELHERARRISLNYALVTRQH